MNIIAYTYDADTHCIDCAVKRNESNGFTGLYKEMGMNNATVLVGLLDNEGNLVHPVFSTDEWQELDESFLVDNPTQWLACGDCHKIIEEYTH